MTETTRLNLGTDVNSKEQDTTQAAEAAQRRIEELKSSRSKVFSATDTGNEVPLVQQAETAIVNEELANVDLNDQSAITQLLQQNSASKKDVSAVTVGRMLGLVTSAEFQLLQGKLDLLASRLNTALTKLDKVTQGLTNMPTGSDLERIDVQLGHLKQAIEEALTGVSKKPEKGPGTEPVASTRILTND